MALCMSADALTTTFHGSKAKKNTGPGGRHCQGYVSDVCTDAFEEVCDDVLEEDYRWECFVDIINDSGDEVCKTELVNVCYTLSILGQANLETHCQEEEGEKICSRGQREVRRCRIVRFHAPNQSCQKIPTTKYCQKRRVC